MPLPFVSGANFQTRIPEINPPSVVIKGNKTSFVVKLYWLTKFWIEEKVFDIAILNKTTVSTTWIIRISREKF